MTFSANLPFPQDLKVKKGDVVRLTYTIEGHIGCRIVDAEDGLEEIQTLEVNKAELSGPSLIDFLTRAREVTSAYEKLFNRWSMNDQIAHAGSELFEIYQARKHREGRARELEETSDTILASLTLYHVNGFSIQEQLKSLEDTLKKVEKRLEDRQKPKYSDMEKSR